MLVWTQPQLRTLCAASSMTAFSPEASTAQITLCLKAPIGDDAHCFAKVGKTVRKMSKKEQNHSQTGTDDRAKHEHVQYVTESQAVDDSSQSLGL